MVHGIGKGKIVWSRPEIIVMVAFGTEKLMQHVLLEVHEVTYCFHCKRMANCCVAQG